MLSIPLARGSVRRAHTLFHNGLLFQPPAGAEAEQKDHTSHEPLKPHTDPDTIDADAHADGNYIAEPHAEDPHIPWMMECHCLKLVFLYFLVKVFGNADQKNITET